jgi:hypothetical protein
MIKFKQLLEAIDDATKQKLARERAERVRRRIPDAGSRYMQFGHDHSDYRIDLTRKNLEDLKKLRQDVWGVSDQERLPDLWASGPTVGKNIKNNERLVAVRPISNMSETHANIFPDAYHTDKNYITDDNPHGITHAKPHVFGRIDHQRRVFTMGTNHRSSFSSNTLDNMVRELKERFPGYSLVDLIND